MQIPPYPGGVPPYAMQPYFGADGRAHSPTSNNYLNALFETTNQLEDMCYANGLQQLQAGSPVAGFADPNLAYYNNMIAPGMNRATEIYKNTMAGHGNNAGHESGAGGHGSEKSGNSALGDIAGGAAIGAGYGAFIGWLPVVGQLGWAGCAAIGAAAGALKHYTIG